MKEYCCQQYKEEYFELVSCHWLTGQKAAQKFKVSTLFFTEAVVGSFNI
jgi:hypothetical protein